MDAEMLLLTEDRYLSAGRLPQDEEWDLVSNEGHDNYEMVEDSSEEDQMSETDCADKPVHAQPDDTASVRSEVLEVAWDVPEVVTNFCNFASQQLDFFEDFADWGTRSDVGNLSARSVAHPSSSAGFASVHSPYQVSGGNDVHVSLNVVDGGVKVDLTTLHTQPASPSMSHSASAVLLPYSFTMEDEQTDEVHMPTPMAVADPGRMSHANSGSVTESLIIIKRQASSKRSRNGSFFNLPVLNWIVPALLCVVAMHNIICNKASDRAERSSLSGTCTGFSDSESTFSFESGSMSA